jgi:hypothetical protein
MKFKKDEMIRLSPRMLADYLQSHGWLQDEHVEGKGTVWLYRDDEGDEYEIMLPTNREVGDFAIRMSEAIFTLGGVEERNPHEVYSTLAGANALPSEIFEGEIAAEESLEWSAAEKELLEPIIGQLNLLVNDGVSGTFLGCLEEIAVTLARGTALTGDDASKERAVWRSCKRILLVAGWSVKDSVSGTEFWNAVRTGQAETLLEEKPLQGNEVGEEKLGTIASCDPESQRD